MITVYQYIPAWDLPCISPYVSKLANYMRLAGLPFELKPQDLSRLDLDAPRGKLPYIVDDDGTKVPDSNEIITYLKQKYGDKLDAGLSRQRAVEHLAWVRFCDEHLYWCGVIEPRWRHDSGWETYIPYIVGGAPVSPELRAGLDAFRQRILAEFNGQGMGRLTSPEVLEVFKTDIDALSDRIGDGPYFDGDRVHAVDATICSSLAHVIEVPFVWAGRDYARGKRNLVDYLDRMRPLVAMPMGKAA